MRASLVNTSLRVLTWCCVILLAILSLLPAEEIVRTGLPGRLEHFVAYAGLAAIAMASYGGLICSNIACDSGISPAPANPCRARKRTSSPRLVEAATAMPWRCSASASSEIWIEATVAGLGRGVEDRSGSTFWTEPGSGDRGFRRLTTRAVRSCFPSSVSMSLPTHDRSRSMAFSRIRRITQ